MEAGAGLPPCLDEVAFAELVRGGNVEAVRWLHALGLGGSTRDSSLVLSAIQR